MLIFANIVSLLCIFSSYQTDVKQSLYVCLGMRLLQIAAENDCSWQVVGEDLLLVLTEQVSAFCPLPAC